MSQKQEAAALIDILAVPHIIAPLPLRTFEDFSTKDRLQETRTISSRRRNNDKNK